MRKELRALDVDGQHIGAVAVAADRVDTSAELRPAEHHKQNRHNHQRHHNANLHIGGDIRAKFIDGAHTGHIDARFLECLKCCVFHVKLCRVDDGRHTLGKEHARKRDDERLNFKIGNQEALHKTKRHADAEGQQDGRQDGTALIVEIDRAAHADKRGKRANGNVDAARDHDEAHAARENEQRCVFVENVKEGLRLFEAGAKKQHRAHIHDDKNADCDDQQQLCVCQTAFVRK